MIRSSRSVINDLLAMGVDFERKADGSLNLPARAHTAVRALPFMPISPARRLRPSCFRLSASWTTCRFLEHVAMTDILTGERDGATVCTGIIAVPWTRTTRFVPPTSW